MAVLSDDTRDALERISRLDDGSPALERVAAIRGLVALLDADPAVLSAIRDAVSGGSGWDQIAEAAGLGTAAAKWRWQGSDDDIAARREAGRRRSARPSSVPTDLPGLSVADAARTLGISAQGVYLRISRGTLTAETVTLDDGRRYKRVLL